MLAWWILIPLLLFFDPDLPRRAGLAPGAGWDVLANSVWYNIVRPIAVGAMLVGACNTLFSMRHSIAQSIAGAFGASARAAKEGQHLERTDRDIPFQWLAVGVAALSVAVTVIYHNFTGSWTSAIVAGLIMTVAGFLLSAVGGYLVGLVGSSNQPLSGLTLSALVLSALVMLAIGAKGMTGVAAVLGVASVVACACSVSGSLIQDLKAGYLLGGTPWKMEVVEIAAVCVLSLFLMLPIVALARSQPGHRRHWRACAARAAGRPHGAACQGYRGRADGLGADRHRSGLRHRADHVRRKVAHAHRRGHVPAVQHRFRHLRGRRNQVGAGPLHRRGARPASAPRSKRRAPCSPPG